MDMSKSEAYLGNVRVIHNNYNTLLECVCVCVCARFFRERERECVHMSE